MQQVVRIKLHRGYIGAFGPSIEEFAATTLQRLNEQGHRHELDPVVNPLHMTLVTKPELQDLQSRKVDPLPLLKSNLSTPEQRIYPLGIGGRLSAPSGSVLFVVVIWNYAQQLRKQLGLPLKQFHTTLSKEDDHTMDKGIDSLLERRAIDMPTEDVLDHIVVSLLLEGKLQYALALSVQLCVRFPRSEKGFIRIGDVAMKLQMHKLAMLSFGSALHLVEPTGKIAQHCISKIIKCATDGTEWGAVFVEGEDSQLPSEIRDTLLSPWTSEIRDILSYSISDDVRPYKTLDSRIRLRIPIPLNTRSASSAMFELPRFFRWIVPFHFAVMSTPRHREDISALSSPAVGIKHIVTLTEETPLPSSWFEGTTIAHTFIPVPNYHPPSTEELDIILRLLSDPDHVPLLVHCGGGKGRAGTVAACYIAAYGFCRRHTFDQTQPAQSPSQAITALRQIRPGSIETEQQERFVHEWVSIIWKRQAVLPPLFSEPPPCPIGVDGTVGPEADLLILVGAPGSGKSSFTSALMHRSSAWRRISQDETSSRTMCEADIGRRGRGKVILDRCNPTVEDRKIWLSLAQWAKQPIAIFFGYPAEICISRAQQRLGHPTLRPGPRVRTAVRSVTAALLPPSTTEGFIGVATVSSIQASAELVHRLSPANLFKFPRTPHLVDLGAVTEDDIAVPLLKFVVSNALGENSANITEKIDGANMGFSLDKERRLLVQNRSHYVNSKTHEQFKKLDLWIETHREGIYSVLDRDKNFPERYILFGEWTAATHSIPYTRLSDRFITFDIYDRFDDTFLSRSIVEEWLEYTTIHAVPVIWKGKEVDLSAEENLKEMVHLPSQFYDGEIEGLYIKVERQGRVLRRGKVVRGDFISGNEHWTKGILRWNELRGDVCVDEPALI